MCRLLNVQLRLGVIHLSVLEATSVVDDVQHLPIIRRRRTRFRHTDKQRADTQLIHVRRPRPDKLRRRRLDGVEGQVQVDSPWHRRAKSGRGLVLMTELRGGIVYNPTQCVDDQA